MSLSAYADALGVSAPKPPANPPKGSGIVTPDQQMPDTHDGSPGDIAELQQAIVSAPDAASKQTLTNLLQQKMAKTQNTAKLSPYAQALGLDSPQAPKPTAQPPQPATPMSITQQALALDGNGQVEPPQPPKERSLLEKFNDTIQGTKEAANHALSSVTLAPLSGVAHAADAVVRSGLYTATGTPEPDELKSPTWIQDAFNRGAGKFLPAPQTETGAKLIENVVDPALQSLMAVAPLHQTGVAANSLPAAGRAVNDPLRAKVDQLRNGRPMEQVKAQFEKPTPQQIEAQMTGAPAETFTPPTLKDASPELQKVAAKAENKGKLNQEVLQRHVEAETLPIPIKLTEGQATLDPVIISNEMNGRGKGGKAPVSPEFYKQQGQAVAANMEAIRTKAAPDIPSTATIVDHGQTLLDAYKSFDEPVKADISAKYKALADANGGELPVSGQAFVQAADAALKQANRTRFVPAEVQGILGDLREGGPMTFADFEAYRTILAEQARKAERAGDGTAAYAVGLVREALENVPMEGAAAELKPLADAARAAAKARFDAIKADPAYKAAVSDSVGIGEPSPLADKFFNAYVTKGAKSNVGLMRQKFADNPLATQTIAAGTLDQLSKQLKADPATGNFSSAGYNKGLDALKPKLDVLLDPETAHITQALGNVAKLTQAQSRGSYVNNSNSATTLLSEGAKASAEHGTNMLFGGLPVGTVTRKVGSAVSDAVGGAKAAKKATAPGAGLSKASDFPGTKPDGEPK